MKIAIDGTTMCAKDGSRGAGIEHYSWSIVTAMIKAGQGHEFYIATPPLCSRIRRDELESLGDHVHVLPFLGSEFFGFSRHLIMPARFAARFIDVLFSPYGQIPLAWRGKSVVTVHDVAIFEHPEWFPDAQDFSTNVVVPKSLALTNRVIAVSKSTANKLSRIFPVTADKTTVIPEGVNISEAYEALEGMDEELKRFPYDRDFVLFLGTIEPRKNLVHAFKAFHKFLESRPEQASKVRFVVAGKRGWKTGEIEAELLRVNQAWKDHDSQGVVQFLGPVTEEEKWHLLARASCLLYPSYDEGFGLPVLEAMAMGTPVIVSICGALPEVGGDAAIYVEPENVDAMSLALTQCLLVPEGVKPLREQGMARAATFTWERAARATLKVLEEVAEK